MRIKRTESEDRRIGVPTASERLEVVEELLKNMAIPAAGPARSEFDSIQSKMDQLDISFPGKN